MLTHKNIDRICLTVIALTLVITVLFMNGKSFGMTAIVDEDREIHEGDVNFTANDLDGSWENERTVKITLKGDRAAIKGNGAYFYDNKLVIAGGGYYEIEGELEDGQILVQAYQSSKVFIRLNGVNITCSDDAAIRVDQADKVFLTLAEGSENILKSGETYNEEALNDGSGGVIFSHDDLTINGSGILNITASYKHGIDANDDLVITGGKITVTAPQDGFHVNDAFKFTSADLTINAGDDGIHSDKSILVAGGKILINKCYEGLEALTIEVTDGDVTVYPEDDGFNANGGSDSFGGFGGGRPGGFDRNSLSGNGGFGMKHGRRGSLSGNAGRPGMSGDFEEGKRPGMSEGFKKGERPEMPEGFEEGERPGMSEDFKDGERPEMPEGFEEGERPEMPEDFEEGERLQMSDDFNEDEKNDRDSEASSDEDEETWIKISGGTVTIINGSGRDSDGLDTNGDLIIEGGDIRVSLNASGGNNAIDYGSESGGTAKISGGTLIACGGSQMAEGLSIDSEQGSFFICLDESTKEGDVLSLSDSEGKVLISYEIPNSCNCITLSCPELKKGDTYTLSVGDIQKEITLEDISTTIR